MDVIYYYDDDVCLCFDVELLLKSTQDPVFLQYFVVVTSANDSSSAT